MWRSGVARQRRHEAVAAMVAAARDAADYAEPWRRTPQVWAHFRDEGELLCTLQQEWRTALAGAVYCAIVAGEGNLQHDVHRAWSAVHRRHRHLRGILEAHCDHPAIAGAMAKERLLLSSFSLPADAAGHPTTPGRARDLTERRHHGVLSLLR